MQETILQFGTGNFLRGFADDFIQQLNNKGLYAGQVVMVSPTDSATVEKINAKNGRYHLLLRGLAEGQPVRDLREIRCISRAVNPYRDFDAYLALARQPALRFVISNTTEAGIQFDPHCSLTDAATPSSGNWERTLPAGWKRKTPFATPWWTESSPAIPGRKRRRSAPRSARTTPCWTPPSLTTCG